MKTAKSIFGVLKFSLGLTGRICISWGVPLLLLLLILPIFGAQGAVVFTSLYSFTGTNDGSRPSAVLVQGSDGNLHGTTQFGGTFGSGFDGYGTVFKISTNGAFTSSYSFSGGSDGANPIAALIQGGDGNLYGTTSGGGA